MMSVRVLSIACTYFVLRAERRGAEMMVVDAPDEAPDEVPGWPVVTWVECNVPGDCLGPLAKRKGANVMDVGLLLEGPKPARLQN